MELTDGLRSKTSTPTLTFWPISSLKHNACVLNVCCRTKTHTCVPVHVAVCVLYDLCPTLISPHPQHVWECVCIHLCASVCYLSSLPCLHTVTLMESEWGSDSEKETRERKKHYSHLILIFNSLVGMPGMMRCIRERGMRTLYKQLMARLNRAKTLSEHSYVTGGFCASYL